MRRISRLWSRSLVRAVSIGSLVLMSLGVGFFAVAHTPPAAASTHSSSPRYQHVFTIMMENTGIEALLLNPNAPWINQAVQTYGVAGNYYGVTHPSQPNYIAATSGALNGVTTDNDATVDVPNIVDQLEAHADTWKAYMQSLGLCGTKLDHACGNQLYERKHNPFVTYLDVQTNPARMANIVDYSQLSADLASDSVPAYVWISPDQCNDMHGRGGPSTDPCRFANVPGLIAAGDAFLSDAVSQIMASKAWKGNAAIIISWDESDFTGAGFNGFGDDRGCCDSVPGQGGGHVLTIVITSHPRPTGSFTPANHYSLLKTTEDMLGLGCLANACDAANVKAMSDLVSNGE